MKMNTENEHMITVDLQDCQNGLGMKIIGGVDKNGNHMGVFVKQILENGIVHNSGKVNLGDLIRSVNSYNLTHSSQSDAIQYIRLASKTGKVKLVIDKSLDAQKLFLSLFEKKTPKVDNSHTKMNGRCSPIRGNDETSTLEKSKERSHSIDSGILGSSTFVSPGPEEFPTDYIENVSVKHATTLGISIRGGINERDGPNIYIEEIIPGGDVHRDGTLRVGDTVVSINGESFVGITNEQAKSTLSRLKLRKGVKSYSVSFIGKLKQTSHSPKSPVIIPEDLLSPATARPSNELTKKLPNVPTSRSNGNISPTLGPMKLRDALQHNQKKPLELFSSKNSHDLAQAEQSSESERSSELIEGHRKLIPGLTPKPENLDCSGKIKSSEDSPGIRDERVLRELVDLLADVSSSSGNSSGLDDVDDDVNFDNAFLNRAFSPDIISTPYIPREPTTGENTISHYLKKDVKRAKKGHKLEESSSKIPSLTSTMSLSLDPNTRIKLEKLEGALEHLGVNTTLIQRNEIRKRLNSNVDGSVAYGDFVNAAREVLELNGLTKHMQTPSKKTLELQNPIVSGDKKGKETSTSTLPSMITYSGELQRLIRERDDALRDGEYFRRVLHEKDQDCFMLEDELQRTRQEVESKRRECSIMRRQMHKVIETQKRVPHDADKIIRKLQKENATLRSCASTEQLEDSEKRLVVLGCQLRKTEVSKRSYEVAVQKLTNYVEKVTLRLGENGKISALSTNKKMTRQLNAISSEGQDTVKSVKFLLEEEPLPFGWEEVYTPDGLRYYMNHVTQTTSWVHPVSQVSRKAGKKKKKETTPAR